MPVKIIKRLSINDGRTITSTVAATETSASITMIHQLSKPSTCVLIAVCIFITPLAMIITAKIIGAYARSSLFLMMQMKPIKIRMAPENSSDASMEDSL